MKKIILLIAAAWTINVAQAQDSTAVTPAASSFNLGSWMKQNQIFQNLDLSVTAGTTGIGIDVASKIGNYVQLRAGYEFMPRFSMSIYFPVEVGGEPAKMYDENGNRIESRFDRLSRTLTQITGYEVDDEVEMVGKPTMNNFKFLVDVFPFKNNKHWHFTAGFYWGPSQFAYAENSTEAMTSLLAVGMFNSLYDRAMDEFEPLITIDDNDIFDFYGVRGKITSYGGHMGFHVGDFKTTGEAYNLEPDADGMVKVSAKANSFKPYLGFGYGGRLLKNRDDWKVSFDAGAMFWGGTPNLITHDGTNLTKDVENISGKVGDWVDFIGGVKVYPVLSVRFTKTIFLLVCYLITTFWPFLM